MVPQLERPGGVRATEASDEMILKRLNGALGGIDPMVVWLNELPLTVLGSEELFQGLGGLVVGDMKRWLVALLFRFFKY